jgi:hypothetical protein
MEHGCPQVPECLAGLRIVHLDTVEKSSNLAVFATPSHAALRNGSRKAARPRFISAGPASTAWPTAFCDSKKCAWVMVA